MALSGYVLDRASVSESRVEDMWKLFERYYDKVDHDRFVSDLGEKKWVLMLEEEGALAGFTTLVAMEAAGVRAVFSGDTIIDRAHWGEWELARAWGRFVLQLEVDYWFLISKGFRTYGMLPLFFREFWPRHDQDTPPDKRALIDALAKARYPNDYFPATGIIKFAQPHGQLRADFADVPDHRTDDPHVRFFLQRNPGYKEGEELACVASLARENLTEIAQRLASKATQRRLKPPEPV